METPGHRHVYDQELAERRLKTLDETELIERLFLSVQPWTSYDDRAQLARAVDIAAQVHANQRYGGDPYIRHPLRGAVRLHDYFGVRDLDILTAIIMHDTVEDDDKGLLAGMAPERMRRPTQQETALALLSELFNSEVSYLVGAMTNPDFGEVDSVADFHASYVRVVSEETWADGRVSLMKVFGDGGDNIIGLHHSPPKMQLRQASKYNPLLDVYEEQVVTGHMPLSERYRAYALGKLTVSRGRLQQMLQGQPIVRS